MFHSGLYKLNLRRCTAIGAADIGDGTGRVKCQDSFQGGYAGLRIGSDGQTVGTGIGINRNLAAVVVAGAIRGRDRDGISPLFQRHLVDGELASIDQAQNAIDRNPGFVAGIVQDRPPYQDMIALDESAILRRGDRQGKGIFHGYIDRGHGAAPWAGSGEAVGGGLRGRYGQRTIGIHDADARLDGHRIGMGRTPGQGGGTPGCNGSGIGSDA